MLYKLRETFRPIVMNIFKHFTVLTMIKMSFKHLKINTHDNIMESYTPQEEVHILTQHNMYVCEETKAIVSFMTKVPWNQMPC